MKTYENAKHTPGPWMAKSSDISDPLRSYEEHESNLVLLAFAPDLLAVLKDLELRCTQDRLAVGIGKKTKQRQIDFLIGSLKRTGKIAAEAIAQAEGKR